MDPVPGPGKGLLPTSPAPSSPQPCQHPGREPQLHEHSLFPGLFLDTQHQVAASGLPPPPPPPCQPGRQQQQPPDSHPSDDTTAYPELAFAVTTVWLPSSLGTVQPLPSTHQVPLLRELGVCGLHENVSLGPALCHLLLQPLHLGAERAWGSIAAPLAALACASSSPGPLPSSQQLAQKGCPWGAHSQLPACWQSNRSTQTIPPGLPCPAMPGRQCRVSRSRLCSSGAGRSERRALQSSRLPRACQLLRHAACPAALPACQAPGLEPGARGHSSPATPPRWDLALLALPCTPCPAYKDREPCREQRLPCALRSQQPTGW